MSNYEIWTGTFIGKTDDGQCVYFADITDTQIRWESDPFYAAVNLTTDYCEFLDTALKSRSNLLFNIDSKTYVLPINIIKTEKMS